MTQAIMLQGTASDVGKSVLVAGLCRIFHQDGWRTAPFKSQNMALNSGITPDGKEMGRAQIMQAEAAGIPPDVRMNPILLKPTSDCQAQVVLMGEVLSDMDAVRYHIFKPQLREQIAGAYQSLAQQHDRLVLEGAGSPAEINLRDRDIVNMGMAEIARCPVILVADIDRGGVFAAIYGTLALLQEHERWRVKGVIINKFRGDVSLLTPGLQQIESLTGVPVVGVMPWLELDLEEEDSVVLQRRALQQGPRDIDIAVVQLPYMSNFTDFNALSAQPDVRTRYVSHPHELEGADLIILPGSKNTLRDLTWLRESAMAHALLARHRDGVPLMGICGGYQMLGNTLIDHVESGLGTLPGLGLLDTVTHFASRKTTTQMEAELATLPGWLAPASGMRVRGYEIHMGQTTRDDGAKPALYLHGQKNGQPVADGAVSQDGQVWGTYLHGLFDNDSFTRTLVDSLRVRKGLPKLDIQSNYTAYKARQFDQLAASMREHIDLERIYRIMQEHQEPMA